MSNNDDYIFDTVLSQYELGFILHRLQADFIPGLEEDALGLLSAHPDIVSEIVTDSLRVRNLAQIEADGTVHFLNELLKTVGVCAYSNKAILIYHWASNSEVPQQYFIHQSGADIAIHALIDDNIHRFSLIGSEEQLRDELLALCNYEDKPSGLDISFDLPNKTFANIRETATFDNFDPAIEILTKQNVNPEAARIFVEDLAKTPNITIFQLLKQSENGQTQRQDVTLLQGHHHNWLISTAFPATTDTLLHIKTGSTQSLFDGLAI